MTTNQHTIEFSILDGEHKEYSIVIAMDSSLMAPEIRQDALDSAFRLMRRRIAMDLKIEAGQ